MSGLCVLADWELSEDERRAVRDTWPSATEVVIGGDLTDEERSTVVKRAEVVVGYMKSVTPELLHDAGQLRLVHMLGHGVDGLMRAPVPQLMAEKGVRVATADAAGPAIAEYVLMSLIALGRRLVPMHDALATRGEWRPARATPELRGSTLCVIGLGDIGAEMVRLGRAVGMTTVAVTRNPDRHENEPDGPDQLFSYADLEQALAVADHIAVCAPLTRDTEGLLDAKRLAATKDGAFLVNVARGEIVDEEALYQALSSGKLGGAAIDAWWSDRSPGQLRYPSRFPIHQFNVIMTPHCCGGTAPTRRRALAVVGRNVAHLAAGEPLVNEVSVATMIEMAGDAR